MSKEIPVSVPGKKYFAYQYREHTQMKHKMLRCYLEKWLIILGKYHSINYFDCFGGCGLYTIDSNTFDPGSPLIAAQIWQNKGNQANNLRMVCIESKQKNLQNLETVFNDYHPSFKKTWFVHDEFDRTVNAILDNIEKSDKVLAPSFFFVDPFGFSLKYSTIKRIMSVDKSEVFLNFMYDSVQRHITNSKVESCLDELFGCEQWRDIGDCPPDKKEQAIIGLYRDQMKKTSSYVMPFKVCYPDRNRTIYYLVHLTNNLKGATIMKSCVAETNNGVLSYLGKQKDQSTFYEVTSYKEEELRSMLVDLLSLKNMTFNDILSQLIDSTQYLEKDIRAVLNLLRKEGKVKKTAVSSVQERALKENDVLSLI